MRAFRTLSPGSCRRPCCWPPAAAAIPTFPGSGSPSGAPTTAGTFTAVVSFGDSLSDVGSYAPATSLAGNGTAPYFGGRFTTNDTTTGAPTATPLGKVWVENLAASLGLIVTPAEVGFGSTSVQVPGGGGARARHHLHRLRPGRLARDRPERHRPSPAGALTVPVVTQVANHLTRFGSFKSSDLILVYAGNNDVFIQFGAFAAAAAQIQADAAAGLITPDRANLELFNAQQVAQEAMKTAALELAALVKTADPRQGRHLRRGDDALRHRRHAVRQLARGGAGALGADRPVGDLQPVAARRPHRPAGADHRHLGAVQGRLRQPRPTTASSTTPPPPATPPRSRPSPAAP